jgi:DNA-binding PadR family transcriptional regulator
MIQTAVVGRPHDDRERYYQQLDIDKLVAELNEGLARGEHQSIEEALTLLERDPYLFRSGYARERVGRRLASVQLTALQKARARAIVLSTVDGYRHCPQPGIGRLAEPWRTILSGANCGHGSTIATTRSHAERCAWW